MEATAAETQREFHFLAPDCFLSQKLSDKTQMSTILLRLEKC